MKTNFFPEEKGNTYSESIKRWKTPCPLRARRWHPRRDSNSLPYAYEIAPGLVLSIKIGANNPKKSLIKRLRGFLNFHLVHANSGDCFWCFISKYFAKRVMLLCFSFPDCNAIRQIQMYCYLITPIIGENARKRDGAVPSPSLTIYSLRVSLEVPPFPG